MNENGEQVEKLKIKSNDRIEAEFESDDSGYYQGYNTLGVQYRAYVKDQSLWLQQILLSHYSVLRKQTVHSCVRMPLHTLYTHNFPTTPSHVTH